MKKFKGFTLIELLIVIAIVAILAAVTLIAINPGRQLAQTRDARRWSEANAILNALSQYQIDNGAVPSCAETTTPVEVGPGTTCTLDELVPTYIAGIPTGPLSGEYYRAWVTTTTPPYRINVDAPGAELTTITMTR